MNTSLNLVMNLSESISPKSLIFTESECDSLLINLKKGENSASASSSLSKAALSAGQDRERFLNDTEYI